MHTTGTSSSAPQLAERHRSGRLLTPAHIGTYPLADRVDEGAHIAGYALAGAGFLDWLPFARVSGRLR